MRPGDLFLHAGDKGASALPLVTAGRERILPLAVRQLRQQVGRPADILGRDVVQQVMVTPVPFEIDVFIVEPGDEPMFEESVEIAPRAVHDPGAAEAVSDISRTTNHRPG